MILVISRNKKLTSSFTEAFHFMGILSCGTTPTEALGEISLLYRAIVILEPDALPDHEDFVFRLREYANVPIFAISNGTISNKDIYDDVFTLNGYSANLISKMVTKSKNLGYKCVGDYRLAGIDATADKPCVTYFDTPLPLTKTECMILRFLMRSYPEPSSSSQILKYAFKSSRRPEAAGVRTHISAINKKFKEITGRKLIIRLHGAGYSVLTPEISNMLEEIYKNSK